MKNRSQMFALCSFLALFCIAGLASRFLSWGTVEMGCFCSEDSFANGECCRKDPSGRQCPGECTCPLAPAGNSTFYSFPEDEGEVACEKKGHRYRGGELTHVVLRCLVFLAALGLVGTLVTVCVIYAFGYRNARVMDKECDVVAEGNYSFTAVQIPPNPSEIKKEKSTPE